MVDRASERNTVSAVVAATRSDTGSSGFRGRHWVGTWNNPDLNHTEFATLIHVRVDPRYLIFQLEAGEETGTPHYQFYIELARPLSHHNLCGKIGIPMFIAYRRGSRTEAREYCRKSETRLDGPWEEGEWLPDVEDSSSQKKFQYEDLIKDIKGKKKMQDLCEKYPRICISHYENVLKVFQLYEPEHEKQHVVLLVGPTGTGKTSIVWKDCERVGLTVGAVHLPWYDGYTDHDVLLIDDFNRTVCLRDLLRVLDRYRVLLPVKGGFVWRRSKIIAITSNSHPRDWYDFKNKYSMVEYEALCRRIDVVYSFRSELDGGLAIFEDYDYWKDWVDPESGAMIAQHFFCRQKRQYLQFDPRDEVEDPVWT